jgi:hypothetical protein
MPERANPASPSGHCSRPLLSLSRRRILGTVHSSTPTTEELLKRAKDLIRESGEYLENFNAAVDQLQKAQAEFRAEHPRSELAIHSRPCRCLSRINQLRFWKKRTAKTTTITSTATSTQFVSVTPRPPYFNQPDDKRIRFSALAFPISPVLPLRASSRSELQNLLRVVPAARQPLCPDVSVFDQTDRTPGWYREFICPSPGTCQTIHQAQLGAPVQDTREVCGRRYFLPFALMRRPPTSDIPIAVCRFAFAHVIAVDHRRPGRWSLVE